MAADPIFCMPLRICWGERCTEGVETGQLDSG